MTVANAGSQNAPLIEVIGISKRFGGVTACHDISFDVKRSEIICLLGDNGAGKSTLIKTICGFHKPDEGAIRVDGVEVDFNSPRDAIDLGIATVYQDLSLMPLMSLTRNFFIGIEPTVSRLGVKTFDRHTAERTMVTAMADIGITVEDPNQLVGTLSGGERQSLAIARAEYCGGRALILDEPTSALGVREAGVVLHHMVRARRRGLGLIFITHNVQHALLVGDRFTVLEHGRCVGTFERGDVDFSKLSRLMGGGDELDVLAEELQKDLDATEPPPETGGLGSD